MRQRSLSKTLHDKVQQLKNSSSIAGHYLARMLKILPLPPEERTLDDIALLMEGTKEFSFFWKFHENEEANIHEQCCQHLYVEHYSKGSIVIRQGDEGDKMFLVLSGDLDVYATQTEIESKQYQQEQIEKENTYNIEPRKSSSNLNLNDKSRSPRRTQRIVTQRESSIPSVPTDEDMSPTMEYGRKATEDGDSEKSGSESRRGSLWAKVRKLKPSSKSSSKNNTIRMIDIKELAYFSNLDALRGDNDSLWDGCYHLKYLNTIKSGAVFGEMALTTRRRRGATVIAMEDCILGVLKREDFNRIVQTYERKILENTLDFFRQALKINLSQEGMMKLSKMFQEEKATFRQTIFHEGNPADGFYIVKSGEVLAYRSVKYPVEDPKKPLTLQDRLEIKTHGFQERKQAKKFGLKYPVKKILAGQLLGDEVLLQHEKRIFTAECQSDTAILLYISYERFERFLSRLRGLEQPLLQQIATDYDLIQERLTGIGQYVDQFIEIAKPKGPANQNLSYSHRVPKAKIEPLHNILTKREGASPAIERSHSPQLQDNINASSIFILSEIQTPKFSRNASMAQDTKFFRCHKTNEEALEASCDTVKHIVSSNEKIFSNMYKNYNPNEDPFLLKEYPFLDLKIRAVYNRKGRSLTPEPRDRHFAALDSVRKSPSAFMTGVKDEDRLSTSNRCRRLLKRVFESGRKTSPLVREEKSREKSQRELKEKPLIQDLPMRSVSSPALSLPKGSLLSIVTLKGRNQTNRNKTESSQVCLSASDMSRIASIANEIEVSVTPFLRWSDKEKSTYSSMVGVNSEKYNSLIAAFSDKHSNPSLVMDENVSHISFPVSEYKNPHEKILKLKKTKSFEGRGPKVFKNARAKKQLNLMVKGKTGQGMHVIEEEKPNTPSNFKTIQIPQKPPRALTPDKQFFEPSVDSPLEPPKFLRSTTHSMFRFRSTESSRKKKRLSTPRIDYPTVDSREDTVKVVDIELEHRKTMRV